LARKWFNLLWY